ncbi:MAG: hypothetical protein IAG10_31010 [Planctomycetaceae bacterium]|nr:hypothetical protein [Planctomycetaceae bacterium]
MNDDVLIDVDLIPDPDATNELGPNVPVSIADEDLRGCRFLLTRRAVEAIKFEDTHGGAIQLACTFHPAQGMRFTWARVALRLKIPEGSRFADVGPVEVREREPVRFAVDRNGKLSLASKLINAEAEQSIGKEFVIYHCAVRGSGEGTALARWDFEENPHSREGLLGEQVLALTLPHSGRVEAIAVVTVRVARSGVRGKLDAVRDLVFGMSPEGRFYPVAFDIPTNTTSDQSQYFVRFSI